MGEFLKMNYTNEIKRAMKYFAKDKKTIFLGQSVEVPGNLLFKSLGEVPRKQKLEVPVFEETQMGMATGLALEGFNAVSCYPRFDFFILSLNQTINHLDKMKLISSNEFNPFVIIRVLVGGKKGIDAGPQHTGNYTVPLKKMAKYLDVVELKNAKKIFQIYKKYFDKKKSVIFIEYSDLYT